MIIIRSCLMLIWVIIMVSAHIQISQRIKRKSLTTIRLGALESQTVGETPL